VPFGNKAFYWLSGTKNLSAANRKAVYIHVTTPVICISERFFSHTAHSRPKKIYRLKEDQAFSLSLELGRRKKVARHPSADFLLHSVGGGGDFVDTVIAVKML
jgi:hypothetical protein